MGTAKVRPYLSPTLVLLALDWPDGKSHPDFLGFAIRRAPGFSKGEKQGYLFNKIGFIPLGPNSHPMPSNVAPIQKFMWWDSAINTPDRGKSFAYTVVPVLGTGPNDLRLQEDAAETVKVTIPRLVTNGIGTYFNRAVVSSQAFSREFPPGKMNIDKAMAWLANGLGDAIPAFLKGANLVEGAVYHLTDNEWVLPALEKMAAKGSLVYALKPPRETINTAAVALLEKKNKRIAFDARSKTNIMHDKFLVRHDGGPATAVLTGSANFTPEGLTSQANVLHTFASPGLAALYAKRRALIAPDPAVAATATSTGWSPPIKMGATSVRVFFSPEPSGKRVSLDTVVAAVKAAKQSAIFCMFSPTDKPLLDALFAVGDKKKILFGLLNSITDPSKKKKPGAETPSGEPPKDPSPATQVQVTIFNRSRKDKVVLPYAYFSPGNAPQGFLPELSSVDFSSRAVVPPPKVTKGKKPFVPAVHIHHKFIVLDAETKTPTIYTGSANFSKNSTNHNDENLLEITGDAALAQTYLAEFLRLYEHYRARALYNVAHPKGRAAPGKKGAAFVLKRTRDEWVKGAYKAGTKEFLARVNLVG
jgi:phosphatidylserine/phosphatidylglycerophosphate/cardiolipin synthase-like enzyme